MKKRVLYSNVNKSLKKTPSKKLSYNKEDFKSKESLGYVQYR